MLPITSPHNEPLTAIIQDYTTPLNLKVHHISLQKQEHLHQRPPHQQNYTLKNAKISIHQNDINALLNKFNDIPKHNSPFDYILLHTHNPDKLQLLFITNQNNPNNFWTQCVTHIDENNNLILYPITISNFNHNDYYNTDILFEYIDKHLKIPSTHTFLRSDLSHTPHTAFNIEYPYLKINILKLVFMAIFTVNGFKIPIIPSEINTSIYIQNNEIFIEVDTNLHNIKQKKLPEPKKVELPHLYTYFNDLKENRSFTHDTKLYNNFILETQKKLDPIAIVPLLRSLSLNPDINPNLLNLLLTQALELFPQCLPLYEIAQKQFQKAPPDIQLLNLNKYASKLQNTPHKSLEIHCKIANLFSLQQKYTNAIAIISFATKNLPRTLTTQEIINVAYAYNNAQNTPKATQFLNHRIKPENTNEHNAELSYVLATILKNHNEPTQSIINAAKRCLQYNPTHLQACELLAETLYNVQKIPEALAQYHLWVLNALQQQNPTNDQKLKIKDIAAKTAQIAASINDTSLQAFMLNIQLNMESDPHAKYQITDLLIDLYTKLNAFNDLLHYINLNLKNETITKENAAKLHLKAADIYEIHFQLKEHAQKHREKARKHNPNEPKLIIEDIQQLSKKLQYKEQIPLWENLILNTKNDNEVVPHILSLAKLYQDNLDDPQQALKLLRKANSIQPNNRIILLELRTLLRKLDQFYELANVLEKLAKISPDNQSKKNFLTEASDIHYYLQNKQIANRLQNEALLLSPINPNFPKTSFQVAVSKDKHEFNLAALKSDKINQTVVSEKPENIHNDTSKSNPSLELNSKDIFHIEKSPDPTVSSEDLPIELKIQNARVRKSSDKLLQALKNSVNIDTNNPKDARTLQEIGSILFNNYNDLEQAKEYLIKASNLDTEVAQSEETLTILEQIFAQLKMHQELAELYKHRLLTETKPQIILKYKILLTKLNFESLNNIPAAISTLESMVEDEPNNQIVLQLLAQIYTSVDKLQLALRTRLLLRSALSIEENTSTTYINNEKKIAEIYTNTNRPEIALKTLLPLLNIPNIDHIDLLENAKSICRSAELWDNLKDLLLKELSIKLNKELILIDLYSISDFHTSDFIKYNATQTLLEIADLLAFKCDNEELAKILYEYLITLLPNNPYPQKRLSEMQ